MVNAIGIVCVALAAQVTCACQSGWEAYNGSCYIVSSIKEDWLTASTSCGVDHGHLVEVTDVHEEHFLEHLISRHHAHHRTDFRYWLGGTDMYTEGKWQWSNNDQHIVYSKWNPSQPNDQHGQDCMVMQIDSHHSYGWDDQRCHEKNKFVCEISRHWTQFG